MNMCVLAGSPKGKSSVTMQYLRYLEICFPQHNFSVHQVAQRLKGLEHKEELWQEVMDSIADASMILWTFPLYYGLVSSQYKRFVELLFERGGSGLFDGQYGAAISSSIHFYDHTAHTYIREINEDLGLGYLGGFSAKMNDLTASTKRRSLEAWFAQVCSAIEAREQTQRLSPPLPQLPSFTWPTDQELQVPGARFHELESPPKLILVGDSGNQKSGAGQVFQQLHRALPQAQEIDLDSLAFGPCLGCCSCGFDNRCVYGQDQFTDAFQNQLLQGDVIVYVLRAVDRYFSARWQRFMERHFQVTHQPRYRGKKLIFVVDGPLSAMANGRELLLGLFETFGAQVVAMVSTEAGDKLPALLSSAIEKALSYHQQNVSLPVSFRGFGGLKVFRDEVRDQLKFIFRRDHRFYQRHGVYGNPVKRMLFSILSSMGMTITALVPGMKKNLAKYMVQYMPYPLQRVVAAEKARRGS